MTKNTPPEQPSEAEEEQSSPLVPDDFSDYQSWVRRADLKMSFSQMRKDWGELPANHTASFLAAVRQFRAAKNTQAGEEGHLLEAAKELSLLEELDNDRRALRAAARSVKEDLKRLVEALAKCKGAMNEVSSQLDALDDALSTRPKGDSRQRKFRQRLQDHHEKLRESADAEMAKCDAWIKNCQPLVDVEWSFNNYNTVIACAKEIHETIPARESSPTPASDNERSSSKRKHTEEAEGSASKAVRSSAAASVPRNRSVRASASDHDSPSVGNRPIKFEGAELKWRRTPSAAYPQPSRSARPGGSPDDPIELSGDKSHEEGLPVAPAKEPVAPSRGPIAPSREPVAPREYLPLPANGVRGEYATTLIRHLPQCPLSFINWCRGQLLRSHSPTYEHVEPLMKALVLFHQQTLPDHDWENEPNVPFLPFSSDDFNRPWGAGRNWPNVRRLLKMVEGNDVCRTYFMRHISHRGVTIDTANKDSADYIRLIQRRGGPEHDWEQEPDQSPIGAPSLQETAAIPLEGLRPVGRWSVSDPIRVSP
jgi:hypothetical protein